MLHYVRYSLAMCDFLSRSVVALVCVWSPINIASSAVLKLFRIILCMIFLYFTYCGCCHKVLYFAFFYKTNTMLLCISGRRSAWGGWRGSAERWDKDLSRCLNKEWRWCAFPSATSFMTFYAVMALMMILRSSGEGSFHLDFSLALLV